MTPDERRFLLSHRVARLATVDAQGRPHALPVCFAIVGEAVYTPVDEKPKRVGGARLRRVQNIAANAQVCLVVDRYAEDWERLAWLQVRGRATLVDAEDERRAALTALRARYAQYARMDLESRPLIRITPERIVVWAVSDALLAD